MAVKLSGKSIGLSNKGIGRRKNYIENPVDDVIKASGIRIKSYDGRQIALRRYISREDESLFNELPETKKKAFRGICSDKRVFRACKRGRAV